MIAVHLKGTFGPAHHAAGRWREQARAADAGERDRPIARIINTTSVSGIYGNPGQTNYGAAKMGIAAFTFIASLELARYGVTVNAVAPAALTRMTENLGMGQASDEMKEAMSPRWIAPIVTWLASEESSNVTGRVFEASGGVLAVAEGWHRGPSGRTGRRPGRDRSDRRGPAGPGAPAGRHERRRSFRLTPHPARRVPLGHLTTRHTDER